MSQVFRRHTKCITIIITFAILILIFVGIYYLWRLDNEDVSILDLLLGNIAILTLEFLCGSFLILPPDFEYTISFEKNVIIFIFSDYDIRRIDVNFTISEKTWEYLLIEDDFSVILLAYNKKVLQFLEEIQKN